MKHNRTAVRLGPTNLFSTAVPIWGQISLIPSGLSPNGTALQKGLKKTLHRSTPRAPEALDTITGDHS